MGKADSMLAILWLLQSRASMKATELAAELEISVRTVYRYIDSLCMSGVPIISEAGHNGGYRLAGNFRYSPLFFDDLELKALFHTAEFAFRAGYPHSKSLESVLEKLRYRANPNQRERMIEYRNGFDVLSQRRGGPVESWLSILENAVTNGQTLNILYHAAKADEPEWRTVDPYGVAYDCGLWYVAAFCHKRSALRDFRVDRIRQVCVTKDRFQRPSDFSVSEYFSNREFVKELRTGPFTEIQIQGTVHAINSICDHWYLKHCITDRERTSVKLHLNDTSLTEVPPTLLSYGTSITIMGPKSLKEALFKLAHEWADHHSNL